MTKTVLVTGMGGNVGQGIVRSIRATGAPLRIVGTNTEAVCGGNHLCDVFGVVPYAVAPDYLPSIRELCAREAVDLIIPATDYETYHLGLGKELLPVIAVSPASTARIFLDKLETARVFSQHSIPFAETILPRDYHGQFESTIVKPREGRGSRGIHVEPLNPQQFPDEYIVQRRYLGTEVTSAFYVRRDGSLHGHVTMARSLSHGMTSACEVIFAYDEAIEGIIRALIAAVEIRGSCNIQSMVTAEGAVIPFEVNGRLSGTTSIRSQFGFPDAQWTIEEYLLGQAPAPPRITKGAAVRIVMDVIYPGSALDDVTNPATRHFIF